MPDLPLPLVIPYRLDESARRRGDELRLLLRSVARHVTGLSRVVLVCQDLPEWLTNPFFLTGAALTLVLMLCLGLYLFCLKAMKNKEF